MYTRSLPSIGLSLALLVAGLAPVVGQAGVSSREKLAAAAEALDASPEETRASAAKRDFDRNFQLETPAAVTGQEPDFYRTFRRAVSRRVGRKHVMVTPDVAYGILFTGPSTYHEGERTPIPPASTNKIFTLALVLKELGGDFTYDTRLTWMSADRPTEAGYLTFVGSGDPSIATADLPKLAEEYAAKLSDAGIRKIYGALRFSATDPRWNIRTVPEGWSSKDIGTATGFIPDALGTLIPARVKTVLAAAFAKKRIQWTMAAAPFAESVGTAAFASHRSAPLRELIQPFALHSINYKGEAFLRKVGELKGSPTAANLHEAGLPLLRKEVADLLGPGGGYEDLVINDGSGLSRTSRVTAEAMVNFLAAVQREDFFPDFLAALPTAGRSGTLDHRMNGTSAAGRVHAKTGTLDGYYQLVGYLAESAAAGTVYHPFAILTETAAANAGYCHSVEDAAVEALTNWMLSK